MKTDKHDLMISYDSLKNRIIMFDYYEENYEKNGIKINEPYMELKMNVDERSLTPIYYRNSYENIEYDLSKINEKLQDTLIEDMFQYAFKWFSDLNDKNYYLASEQLYQSNDKSSIYMIEYGQSNIIHHSDMPYTKLNAYCQK